EVGGGAESAGRRNAGGGKKTRGRRRWAEGTRGRPLAPRDRHELRGPATVPPRVANAAFEREAAVRLGAARVSTDPPVRVRHGHGHTQEDVWDARWGAFARVPDLVVWPASEEEVRDLVALARRERVCLVPFRGRTDLTPP